MTQLQANPNHLGTDVAPLPIPANTDHPFPELTSGQRFIEWLLRIGVKTKHYTAPSITRPLSQPSDDETARDDWQTVASLCGHEVEDFVDAGIGLPLTSAEIDHFRRNHRETDNLVSRDFLAARSDLPSPLAELYGLYRHRARMDAEAALFVAQATSSTRVARVMADLLAIGSYASGHEHITHMAQTYSVPAAFDTSDIIDRANDEAMRRLKLPADHPAHLLHLSPDEISVLASNIVEKNVLSSGDFIEKASLLAEARLDVDRLQPCKRFATSVIEGDLVTDRPWVARICAAYARILGLWVAEIPNIDKVLKRAEGQAVSLST